MLPFKSLDAVTAPGIGLARDLEGLFGTHTMLLEVTGNPQNLEVFLEGSHDGVYFHELGRTVSAGFITVTSHLVRHVRARVGQLGTGTNPTATASIASQ